MDGSEDVCVLIPTLNEAETIGDVIDGFRDEGFENIFVIDGGSSDDTRSLARDRGARVVVQSGTGKGQAVREALVLIEAPYVLMVDGDGTYRPADAHAMLEPIFEGRAEHVVGNRFAHMEPDAMSHLNRLGNRLINRAFRTIHGQSYEDILSGYRAFTRDSVDRFWLSARGFGIETELAVECVKHDVPTAIVPVHYGPRPDDSNPNLRPFRDGSIILLTLYRLAKTNNPLLYFGILGGIILGFGVGIGAFVGIDWITRGVSHQVLAIVAAVAVLFGTQLIMFGIISDMIIALYRERIRRIE